jgi:hypothetical protein
MFQAAIYEIASEYDDTVWHSEVRKLNNGEILQYSLPLIGTV